MSLCSRLSLGSEGLVHITAYQVNSQVNVENLHVYGMCYMSIFVQKM